MRITVQLIRAATDQPFWTQTYDRELRDVLAFQSEVAGAITREIQIKLTPQEQARLSTVRTVNSEAYDYYLRGHERVIQEYREALSLNPNLDEAHHQLSVVYIHIGLLDEALQEVQTAIAINPSNIYAQYRVGMVYLYQGRAEEALEIFRRYQAAQGGPYPDYQTIWALFVLGRKDEARKAFEEALRQDPEDAGGATNSAGAVLAASAGDQRKAEEVISTALGGKDKGFIHFHHTAYNIASAYALMNRPQQAIEWLQQAADDGLPCYSLFANDHNLDNLRMDSRFVTFLAKQKELWQYYKTKSLRTARQTSRL